MKFCRQCGQTLSILANTRNEYCRQCSSAQAKPPPPLDINKEPSVDVFSAVLSCENGKITLKSKEGWLLWSGSKDQEHSLQHVVDRAGPILKIRSKKKK